MKAHVHAIGVVDLKDQVHSVIFTTGVNVITGKSSTGKSAMIEIFDYCFGSSDFTVPQGVITKNGVIYFVILKVKDANLILARDPNNTKAFIKEENETAIAAYKQNFTRSYFTKEYWLPFDDYKKEIGRYFGLVLTDVDENDIKKKLTSKKSPTPSIRSFVSFMLQHQNLIANKHAIFYRFDQKEKKEQAIEHFKIFAGFAKQGYFIKTQELQALQAELRQIELQIPRAEDVRKKNIEKVDDSLKEYSAISGQVLDIGSPVEIVNNPQRALDRLLTTDIRVVPLGNQDSELRRDLEREKSRKIGELRTLRNKLVSIQSSISFAANYITDAQAVNIPSETVLQASTCPFCQNHNLTMELEANKLAKAIEWLNMELERSPYLIGSFEEEEALLQKRIDQGQLEISNIDAKIAEIDKQIVDLTASKSQYEITLKVKLKIENLLETMLEQADKQLEEKQAELKKRIEQSKDFLKRNYNIETKLREAESQIQATMAEIGKRFEFEESYHPINLRFSLETFDLWHETSDRKVFLRAMGSGANWLYCHLTLFLALHRYFCSLDDQCFIPTVLFLDQPSQVYFPSILDNDAKFDPNKLAQIEGEARKRPVDEDVVAVTNLYSQLVRFCEETKIATGIEPQIIVTDHADNLTLEGSVSFETLVQGRRWRTHGFIEIKSEKSDADPHRT